MRTHKRQCRRIQQVRDTYGASKSPNDVTSRNGHAPGRQDRIPAQRSGRSGRRHARVSDDFGPSMTKAPDTEEPLKTGYPRPKPNVWHGPSKHYSPEALLSPMDLQWYRDLESRAHIAVKQERKRRCLEGLRRAELAGRMPKALEAAAATATAHRFPGMSRHAPQRRRGRSAPVQRCHVDDDDDAGGLAPPMTSPSAAESVGMRWLSEQLRDKAALKNFQKELKDHVAYTTRRAAHIPASKRYLHLVEPQRRPWQTRKTRQPRGLRSGTRKKGTPLKRRSLGDLVSSLCQQLQESNDSSAISSEILSRGTSSLGTGSLLRLPGSAAPGPLFPRYRPRGPKNYTPASRSADFAHSGTCRYISPSDLNRIIQSATGAPIPPCSPLYHLQTSRIGRKRKLKKNRRRSRLKLGRRKHRTRLSKRRSRSTVEREVADYINNLLVEGAGGDRTSRGSDDECDYDDDEEGEGWPDDNEDDDEDNDKLSDYTDTRQDEASGRIPPVDQERQPDDDDSKEGSTGAETTDEDSESVVEDWVSFLMQQPLGLLKFFQNNPDQARSLLRANRKQQRESGNALPVNEGRGDDAPSTGHSNTDPKLHRFLDPSLVESCIAEILREESSPPPSGTASSATVSSVVSSQGMECPSSPCDSLPPRFLISPEQGPLSSHRPQTFNSAIPSRPHTVGQFSRVPHGSSNYSPEWPGPEAGRFQNLTKQYDMTDTEGRLDKRDLPLHSARDDTFENDLSELDDAVAPKNRLADSLGSDPSDGLRSTDDHRRSTFNDDKFFSSDLHSLRCSQFPGVPLANPDEDSNGDVRYATQQLHKTGDDTLMINVRCLVQGICKNIENLIIDMFPPKTTENEGAGDTTGEVPGLNDSETFNERTNQQTANAHDVDDGKDGSKMGRNGAKTRDGATLKRHSNKPYHKKHSATKTGHDQTSAESTSDERSSDPTAARQESKQHAQRRKKEIFLTQMKSDSETQIEVDASCDFSFFRQSELYSSSWDDEHPQQTHHAQQQARDLAADSSEHQNKNRSTRTTYNARTQDEGKAENARWCRPSNKRHLKKHRATTAERAESTSEELSSDAAVSREEPNRPNLLITPAQPSHEQELPARKNAAMTKDGVASTPSHQGNAASEAHTPPHDAEKPAVAVAKKALTSTKPRKTSSASLKQPEGGKTAATTTKATIVSSPTAVKKTGVHQPYKSFSLTSSVCDDIHKESVAPLSCQSDVTVAPTKCKLKNQLVSKVAALAARPSRSGVSQSSEGSHCSDRSRHSKASKSSEASKSSKGSEVSQASRSSKGFKSSETLKPFKEQKCLDGNDSSTESKSSKGFSGGCHWSGGLSDLKPSKVLTKPSDGFESPEEVRRLDDKYISPPVTNETPARKQTRALKTTNTAPPRANRISAVTKRPQHVVASSSSSSVKIRHARKTLPQKKVTEAYTGNAAAAAASSDEASSLFGAAGSDQEEDEEKPLLTSGLPFVYSERRQRKTRAKEPQSSSLHKLGSADFLCDQRRSSSSSRRAKGPSVSRDFNIRHHRLPSSASGLSSGAAVAPSDVIATSSSLLLKIICATVRETLDNITMYSPDARSSTSDLLKAANRMTADPKLISSLLSLLTTSLKSSSSSTSSAYSFEQLRSN